MARAARTSVAWFAKYRALDQRGFHGEDPQAFLFLTVGPAGPPGHPAVTCRAGGNHLVAARGDLTTSWRGTVQFPPWRDNDWSGDRHQFLRKRDSRSTAAKRQNEAYQAVLSLSFSSGRLGTYRPLITWRRKPLALRRSLWVRGISFACMAAAPLTFWSL